MWRRLLAVSSCINVALVVAVFGINMARGDEGPLVKEESKVPPYTLPDPLVANDGKHIATAEDWRNIRWPQLMRLFETEVYGRAPAEKPKLSFKKTSEDDAALGGRAIRKEVTINVATKRGHVPLRLLLYVPKSKSPVPVILGLNFHGNQVVCDDKGISLAKCWILNADYLGITDHRATEKSRGSQTSNWQIEEVVKHGFAAATMCCGDIEPDSPEGLSQGVRTLFLRDGQTEPDADEWGAIGAWAWGLSRTLDYLETDPLVNAKQVVVWGHSRLGKTALWAAATDPRFAIAISNNSGCGGAALSKRIFGETVGRINRAFPYWFCGNFHKYSQREENLPVDQHELIALIAPRPVYVASATEDLWADPRGEFLAAKKAGSVYALFGKKGIDADDLPTPDHSIGDAIGYHLRTGKHETTAFDWQQYLAFAERHFGMTPQNSSK